MDCPLDYSLCSQTVTLYRLLDQQVERRVVENAYYSYQRSQHADVSGMQRQTLFTLIIPGQPDLQLGDRVYDGIGPDISFNQWAGFIPACVDGLSQVQYVRPYFWQGRVCHTEAGRR